jgi:hypothetical protein
MARPQTVSFEAVHGVLREVFAPTLHAKRIASLAGAATGVLATASLAVCSIGHGLALARGGLAKHAIKQVDRLLSNRGIDDDVLAACWIPYMVGQHRSITVAMDWTMFDADRQATLMLALLGGPAQAVPLLWRSIEAAELQGGQTACEHALLRRLAALLPPGTAVRIVADRGFGDRKLYALLTEELGFDYVIRFRANITVTAKGGEQRPAGGWVGADGRPRLLREAMVTAERQPVGTVVCVRDAGMKDAWCLAAGSRDATARELINLYARRWGIECGFRDVKDLRFGMGMAAARVSTPARRDRLWLLSALAIVLLSLLGAAGEALGYDRHLKSNTSQRRTHSRFRQGCLLYDQIPNMPEPRLRPLLERFAAMLRAEPALHCAFVGQAE